MLHAVVCDVLSLIPRFKFLIILYLTYLYFVLFFSFLFPLFPEISEHLQNMERFLLSGNLF